MEITQPSDPNDTCNDPTKPPVDPENKKKAEASFVSFSGAKPVHFRTTDEREVIKLPWAPKVDVIFDPRKVSNLLNGTVRIMARTSGTEVQIASQTISSVDQVTMLSSGFGCDEYVIKVKAGSPADSSAPCVDSFLFARSYDSCGSTTPPTSGGGGGGGGGSGPPVIH